MIARIIFFWSVLMTAAIGQNITMGVWFMSLQRCLLKIAATASSSTTKTAIYGYITKKRTFFGELSISKLNENINNKSKHKWFPKGYWEVSPSKCEDNQSSSDEDEENSEVDGSHSLLDLVDCSNAIVRMPIAHNSKNFSSKYIY